MSSIDLVNSTSDASPKKISKLFFCPAKIGLEQKKAVKKSALAAALVPAWDG